MVSRIRALPRAAVRTAVAAGAATALSISLLQAGADQRAASPAASTEGVALTSSGNPVTPGDFNGFGFDQCLTPSQRAMNKWLYKSPYLAVGIYISGDQRWCRDQPNLTPEWVSTQLRKGWKLLPITLGPQASCQPRFPRWGGDSINPDPGDNGRYRKARRQGRQEAAAAVEEAKRLGIVPGSTLFYDMEGWDYRKRNHCSESAMAFLHTWTRKVRRLGYLSGVYSSASSGIKRLDEARVERTHKIADQIWIARWDGKANTSTTYIPDEGWLPGGRLKQYLGGHNETYGRVTINIDTNYVDLGRGMYAPPETHCGGVKVDRYRYKSLKHPSSGAKQRKPQIATLQCFLTEAGYYTGRIHGINSKRTQKAANAWRVDHGFRAGRHWWRKHWIALLSQGNRFALKFGSAGSDVRRVQRALNAADPKLRRQIDGRYTKSLADVVNDYRASTGVKGRNGIVDKRTWRELQRGNR